MRRTTINGDLDPDRDPKARRKGNTAGPWWFVGQSTAVRPRVLPRQERAWRPQRQYWFSLRPVAHKRFWILDSGFLWGPGRSPGRVFLHVSF